MKFLASALLGAMMVLAGCKETVIEYGVPQDEINDAMHGDLVGKVLQKGSGAVIIVSQVSAIDSVPVNPLDGSFEFRDLRIGNYDLTVRSDNYRLYIQNNVVIQGGGVTYVGEVDLSTVPELITSVYPADRSEVVYNWKYGRIAISILFAHPMDRESVEKSFSTDPPSTGVFYWGNYTTAPMTTLYASAYGARFDEGATITTYSKVTSMTYQMSRANSFADTAYTVTLSTDAHDTSGNHLRFPLVSSFRTVQSSVTVYGIQTNPIDGDIDINPTDYDGEITLTFPRRMDPASTEAALKLNPPLNHSVLWPDGNVMKIWTGGPFPSDTTITVQVDGTAKDRDGVPLNETFSFWFRTAPFSIRSTYPANAELYVSRTNPISMYFNNYASRAAVQNAFSISPAVSGAIVYATDYQGNDILDAIQFRPTASLQSNTKYTLTISVNATDINGVPMKEPYTFSFITRQ